MPVLSSELLKKIRRLHIYTTHLADDVLAGAYRSAFKGKGMEFEEVKDYQEGDDIRSIDWNVTARMNRPYVKSFREERELSVNLVVDVSASTRFGSGEQFKSDLIAEIAAVIAFSAIKNNDKIALILFSDRVEKYFPPQKGTRHVLRLIRELLTYQPKGRTTNIGAALSFLGKVQTRKSICFLISDFIGADYSHEAALAAKRHDLVPMMILDPVEKNIPDMAWAHFVDLESGVSSVIDTSSPFVIKAFQQRAEKRISDQKKLMQKFGTELCVIQTNLPYLPQLRRFFLSRKGRSR
jgi:uncharacterized protein (DUF58 family)